MTRWWSRRRFINSTWGLGIVGLPAGRVPEIAQRPAGTDAVGESRLGDVPASWPQQDPAVVREMVGVCHRDVARVRELVERQPALANAAIDWGFGDWEDALGAASHVGRREIAEVLLAHGARPSIFSAAMLGQLDVVKALVAARPGVQQTHGPHGITLMAHARAGGADAAPVVKYLETLGDADRRLTTRPLDAQDRDAVVGRYAFGAGPRDYLEVDVQNDQLGIIRPGATRHFLHHAGALTFFPSGVPSVTIAFARAGGRVAQLTVADRSRHVTARKSETQL
ncbi:MAG TPA: hypothetical protein VMO26_29555 [Vicinamibacterales bacterium]|nr:hypothetical protein [Vicinamibacterales bacterium]